MRGPDRGSDYRRRQLVETMRGHTLSGHAIARRLRTRAQSASRWTSLRPESGPTERRHSAEHQFARD